MDEDVDINIDIDLDEIGRSLAMNPAFIRLVSEQVRLQLSKDARRMGDLLGKWAQRPVPTAAQVQTPGTNRIS